MPCGVPRNTLWEPKIQSFFFFFPCWDGEARREEGQQGRWQLSQSRQAAAGPLPVRDPDKWRLSLRCRGTSLPGSRQTRSRPGTRVGRDGVGERRAWHL